MCGISGIVGPTTHNTLADLMAMDYCLRHRGPDAQGYIDLGVAQFAHRRLKIIDLSDAANQPFIKYGKVLVYNGEVWNYQELREELRLLGCRFSTTSDTEVVITALHVWGLEALSKMIGMFALAWFDGQDVYIARDRFGKCPLHISVKYGNWYFASELKALVAADAHRGARLVEPGTAYKLTEPANRYQWYNLHDKLCDMNGVKAEDAAAKVGSLLESAVKARMISDVPICTMLSGGLDSSLITSILAKYNPSIVAYHAVFDERSVDLKYARIVAEYLGVELREVRIGTLTPNDVSRTVYITEMDSKTQIEIAFACVPLAQAISDDGFKVVFSGDGSDELWGSYGFSQQVRGMTHDQGWSGYRATLFTKQHRLNFARANKTFMSSGVEARAPFTDKSLVEYAVSLPKDIVRQKSRMKAVLEDAAEGWLPESVIRRQKIAFQVGTGLREEAQRVCDELPFISTPKQLYQEEWRRWYG